MLFFFNALILFSFLLFDLMLFYFDLTALLLVLLVLNKEANFWLQWKHQGSLLTEILSERLFFKSIECLLVAVFLAGEAFIEVLINPCK